MKITRVSFFGSVYIHSGYTWLKQTTTTMHMLQTSSESNVHSAFNVKVAVKCDTFLESQTAMHEM